MSTILLTLNSNFTDPSDLDKKVKNVFKMFKNHLKNTSSPMSKESDMESVYEYNKLTPDNVRIFKKLAESNKSVLSLKDIKVDGDKIQAINNDSCSESDSDTEDSPSLPIVFKVSKNKIMKDEIQNIENEKIDENESENEKYGESGSEKDFGSESRIDIFGSESESESESDSESDSEIDTMKSTTMTELSTKIDEMQISIKNIESMLSKF